MPRVRLVVGLTDFGLASTWDLFKNATHFSHIPTQKMLRTVELQVLGVSSGSAGLHCQFPCSKQVLRSAVTVTGTLSGGFINR